MEDKRRYILTLSCPDRIGIVAAVSSFVAGFRGWIVEAHHHADGEAGRFFMRQEILAESLPFDLPTFREKFAPIAAEFAMVWQIADSAVPKRMVVLVSRLGHCLYDLLARWRSGDLVMEIPVVISNHEDFRDLVTWHGIPFVHVPVDSQNKDDAFRAIAALFDQYQADGMVLARYMQILPPWLCDRLAGKILNIHHSFLPSFVGAKPYHQAYARGVKLIGATCHFVTAELDAGPIIEQDVIRIDHSDAVSDLVRYGKDIEKTVLARGLRYFLEDRVLRHGNKTVVFR
ncbi:MAG: formyltetrahydrofolate deformylase [Pseudanabaenaceae cyanobacterium]